MVKNLNRSIIVKDIPINISTVNDEDYISLTDMARGSDGGDQLIYNWMRNRNSLEFLGIWEQIHNPNFKGFEFETFKSQAGLNSFSLTPRKWIESTNAIGLVSKAGRNGGTYAHRDIAFEFGAWLSPEFKLYLIKEFQRLKEQESQQSNLEWQVKRELAKVNYRLQTDAIQSNLLEGIDSKKHGFIYADEADLINKIVFGKTRREWKEANPRLQGNQRDHGTATDNALISNLEMQNAILIREGMPQDKRFEKLREMEQFFRESMNNSRAMNKLEAKPLLKQNPQTEISDHKK